MRFETAGIPAARSGPIGRAPAAGSTGTSAAGSRRPARAAPNASWASSCRSRPQPVEDRASAEAERDRKAPAKKRRRRSVVKYFGTNPHGNRRRGYFTGN